MISKELARKVKNIQIKTRRAVTDVFAGEYISAFKGQGMEFEEVRAYQPGDDIRTIDWNVTARTGEPYIKRYREERELTVLFLIDCSASGTLGSNGRSKNEIAAELCCVLALSALKNNDKVGLILFTDKVESFIPARKGQAHMLRMVRDLLAFKPKGHRTSIRTAIEYAARVQRRKAVMFIVSDFFDEGYLDACGLLAAKHDVTGIILRDPIERQLPGGGMVFLQDPETGQVELIDLASRKGRKRFAAESEKKAIDLQKKMRGKGTDSLLIDTGGDYVHELTGFFVSREQRRAGLRQ